MKGGARPPVTAPPVGGAAAPVAVPPSDAPAIGWTAKAGGVRPSAAPPSAGDVARTFYDAFEKKDLASMGALYADDVKFKDAIFQFDDKPGVMGMWKNLFKTDPNAQLKFTVDSVNGDTVKGHWVADYHVGKRPVHNEVATTMKVRDGKITEHTDDFSWKKWAPQAFPGGKLFTLPGLDALAKALVRGVLG